MMWSNESIVKLGFECDDAPLRPSRMDGGSALGLWLLGVFLGGVGGVMMF